MQNKKVFNKANQNHIQRFRDLIFQFEKAISQIFLTTNLKNRVFSELSIMNSLGVKYQKSSSQKDRSEFFVAWETFRTSFLSILETDFFVIIQSYLEENISSADRIITSLVQPHSHGSTTRKGVISANSKSINEIKTMISKFSKEMIEEKPFSKKFQIYSSNLLSKYRELITTEFQILFKGAHIDESKQKKYLNDYILILDNCIGALEYDIKGEMHEYWRSGTHKIIWSRVLEMADNWIEKNFGVSQFLKGSPSNINALQTYSSNNSIHDDSIDKFSAIIFNGADESCQNIAILQEELKLMNERISSIKEENIRLQSINSILLLRVNTLKLNGDINPDYSLVISERNKYKKIVDELQLKHFDFINPTNTFKYDDSLHESSVFNTDSIKFLIQENIQLKLESESINIDRNLLAELSSQITKLQAENAGYQNIIEKMKNGADIPESINSTISESEFDIGKSVESVSEISRMKKIIRILEKKLNSRNAEMNQKNDIISDLTRRMEKKSQKVLLIKKELDTYLNNKKGEISHDKEDNISETSQKTLTLVHENAILEERIIEIEKQKNALYSENEKLSIDNQEMLKKLELQIINSHELNDQFVKERKKCADLLNQNEILSKELNSIKETLGCKDDSINILESQIRTIEHDLETTLSTNHSLKEENLRYKNSIAQNLKKIKEKEKTISNLENTINELQEANQKLETFRNDIQDTINRTVDQNQVLSELFEQEKAEYIGKLKSTHQEKTLLLKEVEDFRNENDQMRKILTQQEIESKRLGNEYKSKIDSLIKTNQVISNELEQSKAKINLYYEIAKKNQILNAITKQERELHESLKTQFSPQINDIKNLATIQRRYDDLNKRICQANPDSDIIEFEGNKISRKEIESILSSLLKDHKLLSKRIDSSSSRYIHYENMKIIASYEAMLDYIMFLSKRIEILRDKKSETNQVTETSKVLELLENDFKLDSVSNYSIPQRLHNLRIAVKPLISLYPSFNREINRHQYSKSIKQHIIVEDEVSNNS